MKMITAIPGDIANYKTIIGIDIGHGETSAAISDSDDKSCRDLQMTSHGEFRILSAVFLSEDDRIVKIGQEAANELTAPGKLYIRFKDRPDRLSRPYPNDTRSKKEILQKFFKAVVDALFQYNPTLLDVGERSNTLIFVGCPSSDDWLYRDREYGEILGEAVDMPVVIMPESRASLIKTHREKGNIRVSKGIVAFDSGSSTFDATYMCDGGKAPYMDLSKNVGASLIEQNMLALALQQAGYAREDLLDPVRAELNMRVFKERYFNNEPDLLFALRLKPSRTKRAIPVEIDDAFMDAAVGGMQVNFTDANVGRVTKASWKEACGDFFGGVRDTIGQNPLSTAICTGGASRMAFAQEMCRETFAGVRIDVDDDPSFCVSRGLAVAGQTDYDCALAMADTEQAVRQDIVDSLPGLVDGIAGRFSAWAYDIAKSELEAWARPAWTDVTLDTVIDRVTRRSAAYFRSDDNIRRLKPFFRAWMDGLKQAITGTVNQKFREYFPHSVQHIDDFALDDEGWKRLTDKLTSSLPGVVIREIDVTVWGETIGWFLVLPLMLVTRVIDGIFHLELTDALSDKVNEFLERRRYQVLSQSKRCRLKDEYLANSTENTRRLREQIATVMHAGLEGKRGRIVEEIEGAIRASVQNAIDEISLYFGE